LKTVYIEPPKASVVVPEVTLSVLLAPVPPNLDPDGAAIHRVDVPVDESTCPAVPVAFVESERSPRIYARVVLNKVPIVSAVEELFANVVFPVKVGPPAKTLAPVPVSSVRAAARFALDGVPRNVATPVPSPVIEPTAGVIVIVEAAVIRPLPFTVNVGAAVAEPNDPTLLFTVARVVEIEVAPEPLTSPERVIVWFPVRHV
jgi:hypothetical protein